MEEKVIYVYENWSTDVPVLLGRLYVSHIRGKEQFSFEYDTQWLTAETSKFFLDPDLDLYSGRHFVPMDKRMFGIFADSCPDRWGRLLMRRREAVLAKREERKPRKLGESDYLLGVYDKARMGALRFKTERNGLYLSDDQELATPPWTTLRTLESACWGFEHDESGTETKWLRQILAPGSSLGGARPKATVQDEKGNLWIAKFPSKYDEYNSGAWEKVVHDLAKLCELDVPESRLETFSKNGSTFLVKRFDRDGERRIHFSSAMTLLGKTDGASGEDGSSYLDLVSFIKSSGAEPEKDLKELWRRIVFGMSVSNTDDHLRNHGFILTEKGWKLSPIYDVNPVPCGESLSLNVDLDDNRISIDLVRSVAQYFGINTEEAEKESRKIMEIVSKNWERIAEKNRLSRNACRYMETAFEMAIKGCCKK